MKTNEIIKLIKNDGWFEVNQKGSHKHYKHAVKSGKVTIPFHGNKEVPKWLENSILKQAGLK